MDDVLDSVESCTEGKELYNELKGLWVKANMSTHKWVTNSLELRYYIPKEELGSRNDKTLAKTLGVAWDHHSDYLTFSATKDVPKKLT